MDNQSRRIRLIIIVVTLLVLILCFYILFSSYRIRQSTGLLDIKTGVNDSVISVSEANHEAKIVGSNKSKVRLLPGQYQIFASANGKTASQTVRLESGVIKHVNLKLGQQPFIPSIDDVNFVGASGLIDAGLSTEQVSSLKLDMFRYKTSVHKIYIDADSFTPGARDRSQSSDFNATFDIEIDSKPFKATVVYSGFRKIVLNLYDFNNSLVFTSNSPVGDESD